MVAVSPLQTTVTGRVITGSWFTVTVILSTVLGPLTGVKVTE